MAIVLAACTSSPVRSGGFIFASVLYPRTTSSVSVKWWGQASAVTLIPRAFASRTIRTDPAVYPDATVKSRLWAPKPYNEDQDRAMTRASIALR